MRVVLDTNTLVSSLLFSGTASSLVPLWQTGAITILVSKAILQEYLRVLAYPKFALSNHEIRALIEEELLPFARTIKVRGHLSVVRRDPDDNKFLECAVAGRGLYVVTGDRDLLDLESYRGISILSVGRFLREHHPESE